MANMESTKQALAKQPEQVTLQSMIEKSAKELARALPEHMRPERLVRIALTCIRQNPKLATCTPESFLGALFTAAQLGVEPIAGRAYLIPFAKSYKQDNQWKSKLEAQFVMGYRGLAELFYRHEKSVVLNWGVVKEGDEFDYELGTESYLKHKPALNRGNTQGFYVIADLGKAKTFHFMSLQECMEHGRKHSKTYLKATKDHPAGFASDSPWNTNPEAMCLKTVLIQLCKVLPLSFEMARAIEQDETSREYRKGVGDVLDLPSTTTWAEPQQIEEPPKVSAPVASDEPPLTSHPTSKASEEIPFGD